MEEMVDEDVNNKGIDPPLDEIDLLLQARGEVVYEGNPRTMISSPVDDRAQGISHHLVEVVTVVMMISGEDILDLEVLLLQDTVGLPVELLTLLKSHY